jgi:hypothetical protein
LRRGSQDDANESAYNDTSHARQLEFWSSISQEGFSVVHATQPSSIFTRSLTGYLRSRFWGVTVSQGFRDTPIRSPPTCHLRLLFSSRVSRIRRSCMYLCHLSVKSRYQAYCFVPCPLRQTLFNKLPLDFNLSIVSLLLCKASYLPTTGFWYRTPFKTILVSNDLANPPLLTGAYVATAAPSAGAWRGFVTGRRRNSGGR